MWKGCGGRRAGVGGQGVERLRRRASMGVVVCRVSEREVVEWSRRMCIAASEGEEGVVLLLGGRFSRRSLRLAAWRGSRMGMGMRGCGGGELRHVWNGERSGGEVSSATTTVEVIVRRGTEVRSEDHLRARLCSAGNMTCICLVQRGWQ